MAQAFAVGDAAALRTVETDSMHFVQIGHGMMGVGDIAQFGDRRDIAIR
jgi:hypothetical protein